MSNDKDPTEGRSLMQVWFEDDEYERIKKAAAADHRSLSSFVRATLIRASDLMLSEIEKAEAA